MVYKYINVKLIIMLTFLFNTSILRGQITILTPGSGDKLYIGDRITISWTGDGGNAVNIEYSTNKGNSWEKIINNYYGSYFDWDVPFIDSSKMAIRVTNTFYSKPYLLWEIKPAHDAALGAYYVEFSEDCNYLLSTGEKDGKVKIWDVKTQSEIDRYVVNSGEIFPAVLYSGIDTIVAGKDDDILIWDRVNNQTISIGPGLLNGVAKSLAAYPKKSVIAAGCYDGSVKVIDIRTKQLLYSFSDPAGTQVYSVSFSDDGTRIIATTARKIFIGEWNTGLAPVVLTGHGTPVIDPNTGDTTSYFNTPIWSAKLSPDNSILVSGGTDSKVISWDAVNDSIDTEFTKHTQHVRSISYSKDGRFFMSGSLDQMIRQYDPLSMKELNVDVDHGGSAMAVDYSLTGDSIVSCSRNNTIRLWRNFQTGYQEDSVNTLVKFRAEAYIPGLYGRVGDMIDIPVRYKENFFPPQILSRKFSAIVTIGIPNRLLLPTDNQYLVKSTSRKDTLTVKINNSSFQDDTLCLFNAEIIQGDVLSEDIELLGIEVLNDDYLEIATIDGLITIEETCPGATRRSIKFSDSNGSLSIMPNPADGQGMLEFTAIEDGHYEISIENYQGKKLIIVHRGMLSTGIKTFQLPTWQLDSGLYYLIIRAPSEVFSGKIQILH